MNLKQQYQYFFRKTFKKRKEEFTEKEEKSIQSFQNLLKKEYGESIGEEWLFEYLSFHFNKFLSAETKMSLQLNWIYGKKGLENYRNRNKEAEYFDSVFRQNQNIRKSALIQQEQITLSKEHKERERQRFSDMDKRLLHCYELNLFEDESKICTFCKNRDYCLKL